MPGRYRTRRPAAAGSRRLCLDEADKRTPGDDALVRQLHVAAGALAHALMEVPRQQPPTPPQPAIQPPSPNVGAPS